LPHPILDIHYQSNKLQQFEIQICKLIYVGKEVLSSNCQYKWSTDWLSTISQRKWVNCSWTPQIDISLLYRYRASLCFREWRAITGNRWWCLATTTQRFGLQTFMRIVFHSRDIIATPNIWWQQIRNFHHENCNTVWNRSMKQIPFTQQSRIDKCHTYRKYAIKPDNYFLDAEWDEMWPKKSL